MGEAICQDVGSGATPLGEAAWIAQNIPGDRFSYTQAKQFVFGALNIYCPTVA